MRSAMKISTGLWSWPLPGCAPVLGHRLCLLFLAAGECTIATAISYEYVVPVIGIFLGWLLGGEMLTWKMLLACAMTVGSVFFIMWHRETH